MGLSRRTVLDVPGHASRSTRRGAPGATTTGCRTAGPGFPGTPGKVPPAPRRRRRGGAERSGSEAGWEERPPWPLRCWSEWRPPRRPGPPGPCGSRRCGCRRCCSVASVLRRPSKVSAAQDRLPVSPRCRVHAWVPAPESGSGRSPVAPDKRAPAVGRGTDTERSAGGSGRECGVDPGEFQAWRARGGLRLCGCLVPWRSTERPEPAWALGGL